MSIEKLSNYQPILVRPKGDNIMPGGNEIEVWQTKGEENRGRVVAYSQDTIAVPDSEGKYNKELRTQGLSLSEAYGNSQDQLARELADLPLRTDTVLAEINGKLVDAKVYDYFQGEDGKTYGAVVEIGNETNYTGVSLDVLRGEYQSNLRASHQGEAVLDAVGVKEPEISPWSPEAERMRQEANMPTFENPRMFDPLEDAIEPLDYTLDTGETLSGDKIGWYNHKGKTFFLIEPTAESRRKVDFNGEYMVIPAEATSRRKLSEQVVASEEVDAPDQAPREDEARAEVEAAYNGVEQTSVAEVDPFDQLPPEVQDEVRRYRAAQQDKLDSERDKDYAQAAEDKRRIYAIGKSISKPAQMFVDFRI